MLCCLFYPIYGKRSLTRSEHSGKLAKNYTLYYALVGAAIQVLFISRLCYDTCMKSRRGFTIVEMIVVIAVIAILATIVLISYSSVQKRARDEIRKQDLTTLAKAVELYGNDNGPMSTGSGCGYSGNGIGWFSYTYSGYTSMMDCLKNANVIKSAILPPSKTINCSAINLNCDAYMKYTCTQSGRVVTYLYANLETVARTSTATDGTCDGALDSNYGMNYYVKITER